MKDKVHEIDSINPLESSINLRKMFPLSHRWPIKKSFNFLALFFLTFFFVAVIDYYFVSYIQSDFDRNLLHFLFASMIVISFLTWLGKYLLYVMEHIYFDYRVENGHFYISKGIFLKQKGSFPLNRITDIYLDRSAGDLIFGLWNIHLSTPTASSGEFAHICGLSERNATGLQRILSELVQLSDALQDQLPAKAEIKALKPVPPSEKQ